MVTLEYLKTRELSELQALYEQYVGSKPHHARKHESLALELIQVMPQEQQEPEVIEAELIPVEYNSHEAIRQKLKPYTDRGLNLQFDGDVWTIKNGMAMDSGHVSVPLRLIEVKASLIMKARYPAKVKIDGQEVLA